MDDSNGFAGTASIYDRSVGGGATGIFSGTQGGRAFLDLKDVKDRPREEFEIGIDGRPALRVLSENGAVEQDLLKSSIK